MPVLPEEILRKVRHIEITTRKRVDDFMSGQYRSHFKGQGVQFSEHRLYVAGDDVRHIDWKVSARSRDPMVKKYEEERELTVLLVVDVSASESFGTKRKLKSEVAAEIGGLLAFAATRTGDKVGVMLFAGEVEKIIPPKKGRQHVLRVIRDLLVHQPRTKGTNLRGALESAARVMKHSGVVFLLSDFIAPRDYEVPLKKLARRHDVVALRVGDERERRMPEIGQLLLRDPESGEEAWVDTTSYAFKKWFKDFRTSLELGTEQTLKSSRIELLDLMTQDDYGETVARFFKSRKRR